MQGIRPEALSNEELLKYAHLKNVDGLPKDWADALIKRFEAYIDQQELAPTAS